jgi:hypothetical protein
MKKRKIDPFIPYVGPLWKNEYMPYVLPFDHQDIVVKHVFKEIRYDGEQKIITPIIVEIKIFYNRFWVSLISYPCGLKHINKLLKLIYEDAFPRLKIIYMIDVLPIDVCKTISDYL